MTSTASSPRGAPISASWPAATSTTRTGRATPRTSRGTSSRGPTSTSPSRASRRGSGDATTLRRGGLSHFGRTLDPPRRAARRSDDPPADPRPRGVRAARSPDGGDSRADPPPRLRAATLLRDAHLPARPHPHRPGPLLLHLLHVPQPADALPRGSLR